MLQTGALLPGGALAPACGATRRHAWCLPRPQRDTAATSARRRASQQDDQDQRRAPAGRRSTATSAAHGSSVDLSSWSSAGDPGAPLDFRLNGSYVAGARGRPRGIVHFVGGAFAGANPQLTYGLLIQMMADAGYTVIATPFAVTFKHTDCAAAVHEAFLTTLAKLRAGPRASLAPAGLPVHGVGHSNGALLHLLVGSLYAPQNASNVLISFNNKEVGDAIPVPVDQLKGVFAAVRGSMGANVPQAAEMLRYLASAALPPGQAINEELISSIAPMLDQVGSVLGEVGDGHVEFKPSPAENRQLVRTQYMVPATLLVAFRDDAIDESAEMAALLRQVQPMGTTQVTLPGTHVTPCGSDMRWDAGKAFSPADALAAAARQFTMADIRRLGDELVEWLNTHSGQGGTARSALPGAGPASRWISGSTAEPLFG